MAESHILIKTNTFWVSHTYVSLYINIRIWEKILLQQNKASFIFNIWLALKFQLLSFMHDKINNQFLCTLGLYRYPKLHLCYKHVSSMSRRFPNQKNN